MKLLKIKTKDITRIINLDLVEDVVLSTVEDDNMPSTHISIWFVNRDNSIHLYRDSVIHLYGEEAEEVWLQLEELL